MYRTLPYKTISSEHFFNCFLTHISATLNISNVHTTYDIQGISMDGMTEYADIHWRQSIGDGSKVTEDGTPH